MTRLLSDSIFEVKISQLFERYQPKSVKFKYALYFSFLILAPILSLGFTIGWVIPLAIVILLGIFFWIKIENYYNKIYDPKIPILQITQKGMNFLSIRGNRSEINWRELKSIEFKKIKGLPLIEFVSTDLLAQASSGQTEKLAEGENFRVLYLHIYEEETRKSIEDAVKSAAVLYQPDIIFFVNTCDF